MGGFGRILAKIKPKEASERSERAFVAGVVLRLGRELKNAKVVVAGSFAKGTFLEGDKDIDIFVLFRHAMEKEAMESIVRAAVENAFPKAFTQIAYAQHPYVRLFLEGRKIDVVPAYEMEHGRHFELRSAVDRSQLHTEFILAKMGARQKDEVRLLKKLLKSSHLYGAEIRVQGFSGYLCELLILKYGTLVAAAKAVSKWKERTFIDISGKASPEEGLAKFDSPLVFIDPVDEARNVSAVVSADNYCAFIDLCRKFCKSKRKEAFFEKKTYSDAQLSSFLDGRHVYCLEFAAPKIVDDVLWGQVRRYHAAVLAFLKKEGFEVLGSAMDRCGESRICIILEVLEEPLPKFRLVLGPPLQFQGDCEKFSKQYAGAFVFNGRLAARAERGARALGGMLKRLQKLPLPSHLSSLKHAKLYKCGKAMGVCRELISRYRERYL